MAHHPIQFQAVAVFILRRLSVAGSPWSVEPSLRHGAIVSNGERATDN